MNLLPALALAALISDDACSARLDHLLSVYREYGLPLPPPDAPLLRMRHTAGASHLDFGPISKEDETRSKKWGWSATIVKPDPVALGHEVQYDRLDFAIKCHERGWHALARAAFRKWLGKPTHYLCAERQLAWDAWFYWHDQISNGAPLPVAAKHMKRALPHTGFADGAKIRLLRSLDLALVPARSAPGSDDALIDALIEDPHSWWERAPSARALARRGFDAVPALIAHLDDDRLTRSLVGGGFAVCDGACLMPVKDVVYQLICAMAGKQLEPSNDIAARTFAAGRWLADAQKTGEEKFVVERIKQAGFVGESDVLFPLLVEKYPMRLPEVYRDFLDSQPRSEHVNAYARALVEVPIPQADKLKVLEYAATHTSPGHRWVGLCYLREVAPKRASELLIAALDRLETDADRDELRLARVVAEGTDPKVWEALARAAKRVSAGTRGQLLDDLPGTVPPNPTCRRLLLALLATHLTDAEVWKRQADEIEVRNHAAIKLAALLGLPHESDRKWGAPEWAQYRERIYLALEHALGR
jgi:hypothetical protein